MVDGQMLEYAIRTVLSMVRIKSGILKQKAIANPFPAIDASEDSIERIPLGALIGKLKAFTGENDLIVKLTNFNRKFRQDFVHHAFFVSEEKMAEMERESDEYFKGSEFSDMTIGLVNYQRQIQQEIADLCKDDEARSAGIEPAKPEEKAT